MQITIKALDPFSSLIPLTTNIKHAMEEKQRCQLSGEMGVKGTCVPPFPLLSEWSAAHDVSHVAQPLILSYKSYSLSQCQFFLFRPTLWLQESRVWQENSWHGV